MRTKSLRVVTSMARSALRLLQQVLQVALVIGVVVGKACRPASTAPASCRVAKNLRGLAMPQKASTGWPASIAASGPGTSRARSTGMPARQLRQRAGLVLADQHRGLAARRGRGRTGSRSGPAGITRPLPKP